MMFSTNISPTFNESLRQNSAHFVDANKMVTLGSGSCREVADMMLARYACYLIAQNSDPHKEKIAFAQTYFAVQTRKLEIIQQRIPAR